MFSRGVTQTDFALEKDHTQNAVENNHTMLHADVHVSVFRTTANVLEGNTPNGLPPGRGQRLEMVARGDVSFQLKDY